MLIHIIWLKVLRVFSSSPSTIKKEILILKVDAIGDFFIWLAAAKYYRNAFPSSEYQITLLAHEDWIDLAKEYLDFDHYLSINKKRFLSGFQYRNLLLSQLKPSYDKVFYPGTSREMIADLICLYTRAKIKYSFKGEADNQKALYRFFTDLIYHKLYQFKSEEKHETQRHQSFMKTFVSSEFEEQPIQIKAKKKILIAENEYLLFLGARNLQRVWPLEKFVQLAKDLKQKKKP